MLMAAESNESRVALVVTDSAPREVRPPRDEDFTYEAPIRAPYPSCIGIIRRNLFWGFVISVFGGTVILLAWKYMATKDDDNFRSDYVDLCKLLSVPLVSLLFTWFHVWLALQMMFYPIQFYGVPGYPIVPRWLGLPINGWQGIVPRKAKDMAERACSAMIGQIVSVDEFMERIDPQEFLDELSDMMAAMCSATLAEIMNKHLPSVWPRLPDNVKEELRLKVFQETKTGFAPALTDLRNNIVKILDIKQMSIDAFISKPQMMVDMFRGCAARELKFIQHVAAVMGFILGLVQMGLYVALKDVKWIDYVLLPLSGLILGYFTNWLALTMTFKPIWPHMFCGTTVNFQGVFLKRQKEASREMARSICREVVDSKAMIQYLFKDVGEDGTLSPGLDAVMEIFQKHISSLVDKSILIAPGMIPSFIGNKVSTMKKEIVEITIQQLPQYTPRVEAFVDGKMRVEDTLASRLSRLDPPAFEAIIHPIFSEDEWILLCVGGLLGIIIGLVQAYALQHIT